jgi:hypothetical protein
VSRCLTLLALLIFGGLTPGLNAQITQVHLDTWPPAPQLLGVTIHLTATADGTPAGPLTYKFEVAGPGAAGFRLLRDFSVESVFDWTPNTVEGTYQLRVTARDFLAGQTAWQIADFQVNSRVAGNQAAVTATAHPLVALFSVPACPAGSTVRVVFQLRGSNTPTATEWRPCRPGSVNFYIGGMAPEQTYQMNYQVNTAGNVVNGPEALPFTAGRIPASLKFPARSVPVSPGPQTDARYRLVLTGYGSWAFPVATDLAAHILWYYPVPYSQLTAPLTGGTMLAIVNGSGTGTGIWGDVSRQQILREIDLAGNVLRETNADRVSEQLMAMGTDPIGRFNHDAIRLPDGNTMVMGDVQRIFPAGTQGSTVPVDIIAFNVIVLDPNFQVIGCWNAFDHAEGGSTGLDLTRVAVRGEVCFVNAQGNTPGGCPPKLLLRTANDWLHANSLQYLHSNGDLLVSLRDQDWVIRIDYKGGTGTGNILWRLGKQGDFALTGATDPYPWFSAQHDAGFEGGGEQLLSVFDNGNSRVGQFGGNSRGQVFSVDQTKRVATVQLNADLGVYSPSLGSAQSLSNGNYAFEPGHIDAGDVIREQCTEVTPAGTIVYQFQSESLSYRSWRLPDLYHLPAN